VRTVVAEGKEVEVTGGWSSFEWDWIGQENCVQVRMVKKVKAKGH